MSEPSLEAKGAVAAVLGVTWMAEAINALHERYRCRACLCGFWREVGDWCPDCDRVQPALPDAAERVKEAEVWRRYRAECVAFGHEVPNNDVDGFCYTCGEEGHVKEKYLDIVIEDNRIDPDARPACEWLIIKKSPAGFVSFVTAAQDTVDGERLTCQDRGTCFDFKHLDKVIEALQAIKASLGGGET